MSADFTGGGYRRNFRYIAWITRKMCNILGRKREKKEKGISAGDKTGHATRRKKMILLQEVR